MHVRISPRAKADLKSIQAFIAEQNPNAAIRTVDRILSAISYLHEFPFLGRPGRIKGTRELVMRGLPYYAVYSLADEYHIEIERIIHGAQIWPPENE